MSSLVQERTAGRPDGGAADDVLAGRPVRGLDALHDAVRALLARGAR